MQASNVLGVDARSLDGLRGQAAKDPKAASRQAAVQMESHFMQMVLQSMREATPKADGSAGNDTFTQMLDQQFARQFSGRPGGLADLIEKQLNAQMKALSPPASAAAQAAPAGPAQDAGAPAAAAAPAGPAAPRAANAKQQAFLERMLPHAQAAERATGVPASFILGQAALESGWGKGEIRNADGSGSFNLFGIKATRGWQGEVATVSTTEYEGGQPVRQSARFRSYGSYAEAFTDYARLLSTSPRYAQAVRSDSAEGFAGAMQRAGYATDPQYAAKLARTINHTLALQRALA
ncbi:flagellar assembly peptidoglycan hydrolase FlgJ [Ramlibacter sp. MAHUQ-53]|uniref:flagellar assembly peptidoglycan hydrolase FlgJ n=1 Tax=unclassified Ramlibacter TaxID=2617605 RepID=UPI00363CF6F2